ncbi:MAG: hypothetical protein Q6361_02105 [Candidatus Hermodarchaeota archaeon]|jgi:hypothetical protein|nr:hypothetical protein [Candidatus Hermodarchaeota archaeon]
MEIQLSKDARKGLEEKGKEANITATAAATLILSEFVRIHGSSIYAGTWWRGDRNGKKGMRYVIDWPFQPGFVKIPGDQSIDLGKGGTKK